MRSDVNGLPGRIGQVRGRLALTQRQFGRRVGVSRNAVSLYERGRIPRSAVLDRIARLGGVSVEWLLHGSVQAPPPSGDRAWQEAVGLLSAIWRDPDRRRLVRRVLRALRPG
jgi:transcriptional regulator with XRE-family HTH domain